MKAANQAGPLVIIGGAEDRNGECNVLGAFVRLAGGAKANIVIMTVASEFPDEVGAAYEELFLKLGAKSAQAITVRQRDQACNPQLIQSLEKASGVFFAGGDQLRITN